jgi:glycosyltransferase involved in cell wall biosynthesis
VTVFALGAFVQSKDGAHRRVIDMLDRFQAEGLPVAVYSFADHEEYPWTETDLDQFAQRWPMFELVTEQRPAPVARLAPFKKIAGGLCPHLVARILTFELPGTPKWVALSRRSAIIVVHYAAGLFSLNGVEPDKCIVETHDINFLKSALVQQTSVVGISSTLKLRWEMASLAETRSIVTISPPETEFFRLLVPAVRRGRAPDVTYVSSWSQVAPSAAPPDTSTRTHDFLFVGSAFQMNAEGLLALFLEHGNWLRRHSVVVAGRVCENHRVIDLARSYPNISLKGFLDDLSPLYRSCRIALAPVEGTGLKIKITEALGFGLPVLASRSAMDGLPAGFDACVQPITRATAEAWLTKDDAWCRAQSAALAYHATRSRAGNADHVLDAIRAALSVAGSADPCLQNGGA